MRLPSSILVFISLLAAIVCVASSPVDEDVRNVIREFARKAEAGDPEALYQMAMLHERGYDSIPRDSVRARNLLERSAELGSLKAGNLLGYELIKQGDISGLNWIEKAAMAGDAKAQSNIGFLLLNSDIVERDPAKAAYWLERAAAGGVAAASSMLGDLYRDGDGVAQDSLQAESHYYAALDAGLVDAAYKLVDMMGSEWQELPDSAQYQKALYLYNHRAPDAALPIFIRLSDIATDKEVKGKSLAIIGDAHTRGAGVSYSHEKSLEYYYKAAEEGDPSAAFVIGELLEIFPDSLQSFTPNKEEESPQYWYDRAAAGGVHSAEEATRRIRN